MGNSNRKPVAGNLKWRRNKKVWCLTPQKKILKGTPFKTFSKVPFSTGIFVIPDLCAEKEKLI